MRTKKRSTFLWVGIALLFAIALLTFPYAFSLTWALPGAETDRTLTYTRGNLTWDSSDTIDKDGAICFSMFKSEYDHVKSNDGKNIVAPTLENTTNVRLLNTVDGSIDYTAVLYRTDETDIPLAASLEGGTPTQNYTLPEGVSEDKVVDAVDGTVSGSSVQMLNLDWNWQTQSDEADTALGNSTEDKWANYALYVTVQDSNLYPDNDDTPDPDNDVPDADNDDVPDAEEPTQDVPSSASPEPTVVSDTSSTSTKVLPKTGDSNNMMVLFVVAVLAFCVAMFVAIFDWRKKKKDKQRKENK